MSDACLRNGAEQLSSVLSQDHAFFYSEFGATVLQMSPNFDIYINKGVFYL